MDFGGFTKLSRCDTQGFNDVRMMVDDKCYCYSAIFLDGNSQHGPIKVPKNRLRVTPSQFIATKDGKDVVTVFGTPLYNFFKKNLYLFHRHKIMMISH